MKRIYKYKLRLKDNQHIKLPLGSKILSVIDQIDQFGPTIMLYALVEDEIVESMVGDLSKPDVYDIAVRGTGHPAHNIIDYDFLGTVKLLEGHQIYHVFYRRRN